MTRINVLVEHEAWYMGLDWIPGRVTIIRHRKEMIVAFLVEGMMHFLVSELVEKRHPGRPDMYPSLPEGTQYVAVATPKLEGGGINVLMFAIPLKHMEEWDKIFPVQNVTPNDTI